MDFRSWMPSTNPGDVLQFVRHGNIDCTLAHQRQQEASKTIIP
jgi:hypothetical protein